MLQLHQVLRQIPLTQGDGALNRLFAEAGKFALEWIEEYTAEEKLGVFFAKANPAALFAPYVDALGVPHSER